MMPLMRIVRGRSPSLDAVSHRADTEFDDATERAVREVVEKVRRSGDEALRELTARFDGVREAALRVEPADIGAAAAELDPDLRAAIDLAAARIRRYYENQPSSGFTVAEDGAVLGQLVRGIGRVGCYVPGGTAPLFSTLLMTAIPARVAGVERVVVSTPPRRDGTVPAEVRYAAALVEADDLLAVGGAQAIAALAYGTETVPRVDKIVGPGNRYVIAAKRLVFGSVGIEALPGPTETLVLADPAADPRHVAADLLAQSEHLGATPVLVTWSETLVEEVLAAVDVALGDLPDDEAARSSIEERGLVLRVADVDEALEVANAFAPEHLCLLVADPWSLLPGIRNAGGVFLGAHSMEALGDYLAGPSHVMPTGATARFASFINLRDFQKVIPILSLTPSLVRRIGPHAARMARAEGLEAHARAIEARLDEGA